MNTTSHKGPGYVLHLALSGHCLIVCQTGRLPSIPEARRVQQLVAKECSRHDVSRIVIDNRKTEAPDVVVRDSMREWIHSGKFEAVGFVLESELLRVGVNMDALQKGRRVRAFSNVDEALRWAERYRSQRPTGSTPPPPPSRGFRQ